ncbi:50S ribosomal protein L15 [soil metagenome]
MKLNDIKPGKGSKHSRKRLGRGTSSGHGKTSGKGHKGQHARAGGYHKLGFEGGQMPLQRRLPKFGFTSRKAMFSAEVRLDLLQQFDGELITLVFLKKAGLVQRDIRTVKVINSGEIQKPIKVSGLKVTKGARIAIEKAQGTIVD